MVHFFLGFLSGQIQASFLSLIPLSLGTFHFSTLFQQQKPLVIAARDCLHDQSENFQNPQLSALCQANTSCSRRVDPFGLDLLIARPAGAGSTCRHYSSPLPVGIVNNATVAATISFSKEWSPASLPSPYGFGTNVSCQGDVVRFWATNVTLSVTSSWFVSSFVSFEQSTRQRDAMDRFLQDSPFVSPGMMFGPVFQTELRSCVFDGCSLWISIFDCPGLVEREHEPHFQLNVPSHR